MSPDHIHRFLSISPNVSASKLLQYALKVKVDESCYGNLLTRENVIWDGLFRQVADLR